MQQRVAIAIAAIATLAALVVGCGGGSGNGAGAGATNGTAAVCPTPQIPRGEWRHRVTGGAFASAVGAPHHAANDVVVGPNRPIEVHGKFAYGVASKDLEDEEVVLLLAPMGGCGTREVARKITDDDGRVTFTLPAAPAGVHRFWLGVPGDGSFAAGAIYVVAAGRKAVLFDIDGTLTTSDGELIEDVVGGGPPQMWADANKVAHHWAARGYQVIYVTGRPYALRGSTLAWLASRGFPTGPVITTEFWSQAKPGASGVGEFKTRALTRVLQSGLEIVLAYGNADTDICAYAAVGIDPGRSFIVGPPGRSCPGYPEVSALSSYTEHLAQLVAGTLPSP